MLKIFHKQKTLLVREYQGNVFEAGWWLIQRNILCACHPVCKSEIYYAYICCTFLWAVCFCRHLMLQLNGQFAHSILTRSWVLISAWRSVILMNVLWFSLVSVHNIMCIYYKKTRRHQYFTLWIIVFTALLLIDGIVIFNGPLCHFLQNRAVDLSGLSSARYRILYCTYRSFLKDTWYM